MNQLDSQIYFAIFQSMLQAKLKIVHYYEWPVNLFLLDFHVTNKMIELIVEPVVILV
jgi:hypothetical protein